jgi:hypothetical protein
MRKNAWQVVEKARQQRSRIAQRLNVREEVRFASSLAAALLDGPFEQPDGPRADQADGLSEEGPSFMVNLRRCL